MLISLKNLDYSVGGPLLLDGVNLDIQPGERVCLVGRNGAGKSTLLKLIAGDLQPDDGEVVIGPGVRIARLQQEVPGGAAGSVFDQIAAGLGQVGEWLAEYHQLSQGEFDADRLAAVQAKIDAAGGWDLDTQVAKVLERLELDGEQTFSELSGGMKRRVALGQALVSQPDLLLLDEPTNHLDIESIEWLENFLLGFTGALVFVTHDRRFLQALATRIVEIDRGQLSSWPGDWDNYLRRVEERAHAEALENERFDKRLAEEEVWIRQGIKARRTRNEGRVRALKRLREARAQRRDRLGQVQMEVSTAEQSGKKVIEATDLDFAYEDKVLVRDFSTLVLRGDRIGLIGPNGSGKSTLIKLLLGELKPDRGEVRLGTNLRIAYFDQHRSVLRDDWTAAENVAEGRDFVDIGGKQKHVIGYLQDFLFTPERARAPITKLSGGERNRLLLAKLFAKPSNLLVMDEPTNDLDAETLDLLEERLADYPGTLLLVSHDRAFLDNVITSCLVMEGEGRIGEYVGGYSDWQRQKARRAEVKAASQAPAETSPPTPASKTPKPTAKKLSYKLARELEQLPGRVEALEAEIAALGEAMNQLDFFKQDPESIARTTARAQQLQTELEAAYQRWEELEDAGS
ncbi:ABC transporter ATPase [Wenzhouxiangella marina]|uniref:ATP-binding protein Uup n=2 Tax=Wenzhouxiangella marina TaxID=1579979 RepID=A0A0K0XW11_9GAMM|nr:ABC transporter ATPase [Wenzhouxiangella marina]